MDGHGLAGCVEPAVLVDLVQGSGECEVEDSQGVGPDVVGHVR